MDQWLIDLLAEVARDLAAQGTDPAEAAYSTRRGMAILRRWRHDRVRAAEQDARQGDHTDLDRYDAEVAAIKTAVPKPVNGH